MDSNTTYQEMKEKIPSPFPAPLKTNAAQAAVQDAPTSQAAAAVQTAASMQTAPMQNAPTIPSAMQNTSNMQTPAVSFPNFKYASISNYMAGGGFMNEIAAFQKYKNRKTGFSNMDALQPFIPGLYALGSVPSNGKTTGVWQLANQQAAMGEYVLYFSLEQTKFELTSKSLSRRFYQEYCKDKSINGYSSLPRYTSLQIRCGETPNTELNSMMSAQIQELGDRLNVFQGNLSGTIEDICCRIEEFILQTNQIPVVIIDYLQIIEASTINGRSLDTKDNIDHIVKMLKQIQMKHNATIIVISSLNRQNYMMPVEMESFKESGNIEYTFDVVWGLQLSILNDPEFSHHYDKNGKPLKETTIAEKRNMISNAKNSNVRSLQLVYLKNRFGFAGQSVFFDYVPADETFIPHDPSTP